MTCTSGEGKEICHVQLSTRMNKLTGGKEERYNMLIFTIAPLVHNFLMKHTVGLSSRLVLLAGNPQGNIW